MTGRDSRIDNAKGVLIILVVLGHLIWPVPNKDSGADTLYFFIYFFHMPMFALISGYLSRAETGRAAVVKNARLLLAPYAVFVVIHWLVQMAAGLEPYPVLEGHYGLWFLLSLFCWRVMLPYVARIPYALPATFALGLAVGFVPFIGMELSLSRTFVLLPFFLAGHLMRQRGESPASVFGRPVGLAVAVGGGGLAAFLSGFDFHPMLYGNVSYVGLGPAVTVGVIARMVQYAVAFGAGLGVLGLVPRTESPLTRIGRYSLHVYLLHSVLLIPYRAVPSAHATLGSTGWLMIPAAIFLAWLLASPPVVRASRWLVSPLTPIK